MCFLRVVSFVSVAAFCLLSSVPFASGQGAASCTAFDFSAGRDCTPDQGDTPTQCLTVPTLTVNEKIECSANFDCCNCDTITCNNCVQSNCNGDSSCLFTDFILNGDASNGGVSIDCNGDISCAGSTFDATQVKEVKCSGDDACASVSGTLDCVNDGCSVECAGDCSCPDADLDITDLSILKCVGDNSCASSDFDLTCVVSGDKGCEIECSGDESCVDTTIVAQNANSLICGACTDADITLNGFTGGEISLSGVNGFRDGTLTVDGNVNGIKCDGTDGCNGALITIGDIGLNDEFTLECNSVRACNGLTIDITITSSSITGLKGVTCGSTDSCDNLTLNIDASQSGNTVIIEKFECGGASSCDNLTFNFIDVEIDECIGVPSPNSEC